MEEGPRPKTEPLIEKVMLTGIAVQTVVLTVLTLVVYIVGLGWAAGTRDPAFDYSMLLE